MKYNKKSILIVLSFLILLVFTFSALAKDCTKYPDDISCGGDVNYNEYKDKIEKYPFVEIEFNEEIISKEEWKDLQKEIKQGYNYVEINDNDLKKSAKLTFKRVFLKNPVAVHNGLIDFSIPITQEGYGIYSIEIDEWSSWSLSDNTWNGTFENTIINVGNGSLIISPLATFDYDFESLEDNISITDSSAYGNDGELTTSPYYETDCQYGSDCLFWDGTNDYLTSGINLDELEEFSISAWISPNTIAGTWHPIITQGMHSSSGVMLSQNANQIILHLPNGSYESIKYDDTTLVAGNTYHVVATFNGTTAKLYLDAVKETTDKEMTKVSSGGDLSTIGASITGEGAWSTTYYDGVIECLQIYDYELDSGEVTGLNNSATCDPNLYDALHTWELNDWIKYQEDSSAYNDFSGSNNGIWIKDNTQPKQTEFDCNFSTNCLDFDGTDDVININDDITLDIVNEISISTWFKTENDNTPLLSKDYANGVVPYRIYLDSSTGSSGFSVYNGSAGGGWFAAEFINTSWADNEWHHVVGIYNGTDLLLYLDNVLQDTTPFSGELPTNSANLVLGKYSSSTYFEGSTQCTQIWNTTLSQTNISSLYSSSFCDNSFNNPISSYPLTPNTPDMGAFGVQEDGGTYLNTTSLELDGIDDYVLLEDGLKIANNFTYAFWMNTNDNNGYPLSRNTNFGIGTYPESGIGKFRVIATDGVGYQEVWRYNYDIADEQWHHIAVSYDGYLMKGYIDSVNVVNSSSLNGNLVTTSPMYFGWYYSGAQFYEGLLDEFNAFDRVLTDEEVFMLYNGSSLHFEPNGTYISEVYNSSDYDEDIETNVWLTSIFAGENITANGLGGGSNVINFTEDFALDTFNEGLFEIFEEGNISALVTNERLEISGEADQLGYDNGAGLDLLTNNSILSNDFHMEVDLEVIMFASENNTLVANGLSMWADIMPDDSMECTVVVINSSEVGGYSYLLIAQDEIDDETVVLSNLTGKLEMNYNLTTSNLTCTFNGEVASITTAISPNNWYASIIQFVESFDETNPFYADTESYFDNWIFQSYGETPVGEVSGEQVWGRAGNCSLIETYSWTQATGENSSFIFNDANGECFQYQILLDGEYWYTPSVENVTISAYKVKIPYLGYINFTGTDYDATDTLDGNFTLLLNDTNSMSYNETWWYVRNNITYLDDTTWFGTNILNGTTHNTQGATGFAKDDIVYFCIEPITNSMYGNAYGNIVCSENRTIQNANFSVTWKPNQNITQLTAKPGTGRTFTATLDDPDDDVNVTWYVDGVLSGNGTEWKYLPELTDVESLFTITGNATDGEYSESAEWTIYIEEANTGMAMIAIMLFLGVLMLIFGLATWYFDNGLKFFFLLLTSLIMVVGLNISATIAETVSAGVSNVLWVVYRVALVIVLFLFFYVMIKLMGELKLRRNAMNTDNLDSPGQNKALIGGRGK